MLQFEKRTLTQTEKEKLQIPHEWIAFEYFYSKVIEERCDQFEYEFESEGFEIIHSELIPVATSIFDFKLIIAKE